MGWRHLVPRRRYFKSLKIARVCPEIAWHIDEGAKLTAQSYLVGAVYLPTVGPLILISAAMTLIGSFVLAHLPRMPDYASKKGDVVEQAWRIIPRDEIRERLGEEVPRILSKKVDA